MDKEVFLRVLQGLCANPTLAASGYDEYYMCRRASDIAKLATDTINRRPTYEDDPSLQQHTPE